MLYANNLQLGFCIDSFVLPRCAILDSPTIDMISAADRRGDAAKGEYGHLRVRFLIIIFFYFQHPKLPLFTYCNHFFCS
jgi:hypothetical protein